MKMKRFSTLNIDSVGATHTGSYECIAENSAGRTVYSAVLNVYGILDVFLFLVFCSMLRYFLEFLVAPQISPFSLGEDDVNEGDTISAQCTISKGDGPLNITWCLNGKPLKFVDGVLLSSSKRVSSLTIESVEAEHAGEYICYASNMAGTSSFSAVLNVNGILIASKCLF